MLAIRCGVSELLVKPYTAGRLTQTVRDAIASRRRVRDA